MVWGKGKGRSSVTQGNYIIINNYNLYNNIQKHLIQNSEVIFCKNFELDFKLSLILMPNYAVKICSSYIIKPIALVICRGSRYQKMHSYRLKTDHVQEKIYHLSS